jgi:EAL domain-containing protein (putative c-di-GMP-specific phosphodiesterase class I)
MDSDLTSPRDSSAERYLYNGELAHRLETTLALAARAMGYPVALVNILDRHDQHTISASGGRRFPTLPRDVTFCDTVIKGGRSVATGQARTDERFRSLPMVLNGSVSSYVGVPLADRESHAVGALCVIDPSDRVIGVGDMARLEQFGKVVEDQLDLMRTLKQQRRAGAVATQELAQAIRGGQIVPWYRPTVEISTRRVLSFEALARWELPDGEVRRPKRFISLATDSDLIMDVDLSVMQQALSDFARWRQQDTQLRLSVNVSGRNFEREGRVESLHQAVLDAGVPPDSVDLQLSESERLASGHHLNLAVKQLRQLGFRVWLSGYATGWSSLKYLLWMPVTGVKLSQIVSCTMGTPVGDALIRSVTSLAKALDLSTTIEGIETADEVVLAQALGCDNGQGNYWSPAVPAAVIDQGAAQDVIARSAA